jgi:hypothetical protein
LIYAHRIFVKVALWDLAAGAIVAGWRVRDKPGRSGRLRTGRAGGYVRPRSQAPVVSIIGMAIISSRRTGCASSGEEPITPHIVEEKDQQHYHEFCGVSVGMIDKKKS